MMTFRISYLWQNKPTRVALEWAAGVVALLCLLFFALTVRLASGPMVLDDLSPFLAAALSDESRGLVTEIASTKLRWNEEKGEFVLELEGVVTRNRKAEVVATLPRADARIKALPLLLGRLSFKRLHVEGANLNLERNHDGQLIFLGTAPLGTVATADDWPLSAMLAGWPQRVAALQDQINRLGQVTVRATQLKIYDRIDDFVLEGLVPELTIATNDEGEVLGQGMLRLSTKDQPIGLMLDMRLLPEAGKGETTLSFRDLNPAALGRIDNDLAALTVLEMPLTGSVNVAYMPEGTMQLTIRTEAPSGTVNSSRLPQPLAIRDFAMNISAVATGSAGMTTAIINTFSLKAGDVGVALRGKLATGDSENFRLLELQPELTNLNMAKLAELWPTGVAAGARAWVTENMTAGTVPQLQATIKAALGWPDVEIFELESVQGQFELTDATIHYFRPMPPALAVQAKGTFDQNGFYIRPTTGRLLGLALGNNSSEAVTDITAVDIKGLLEPVQTIDVTMPFKGSLVDLLTVVDSPPLHYAEAVGLKPKDLQGEVQGTFKLLALPLLKDIKLDDVQMQASGAVRNFANSTLVPALPLTGGVLEVQLDTKKMQLQGTALAHGVKLAIDWQELFSARGAQASSTARISGTFTAADFAKLGAPLPGAMQGAAPVLATYRRYRDQADTLEAVVDFTPVALDMSRLTYQKAARQKAQLRVQASIAESGIALNNILLDAAGVNLKGTGQLSATGELQRLDFPQVKLGDNEVSVNVTTNKQGALRYVVRGAQMNVGAWLDAHNESNQQVSQNAFEADIQLDRAIFGLDDSVTPRPANALKFFAPFRMEAVYSGQGWDQLVLQGKAGGTEDFNLSLMPDGNGQKLHAHTENFGAVLDALNWTDDVKRGRLLIDGNSASKADPLVATITVEDYKVLDLPFIARLLNAVSLDGLTGLLTNETGLTFEKLKGTLMLQGDILRFKNLRTSGGSLGLTAAGTINTASKEIDLEGTVVPFSGVNQVIGSIPILGDLLTGGQGGGVFAATYYAKGPLNAPEFSTNPLATLAPGFVRNMFFLDDH